MEPVIRDALLADAPALVPLMDHLGYPSTIGDLRDRLATILAHTDYAPWVAEVDGQVVGMAGGCIGHFFEKNGCYARLVALVVHAQAQGRGVGSALVREVERWARGRGATIMLVNSGDSRAEAHQFYRRIGYERTGVRFTKEILNLD